MSDQRTLNRRRHSSSEGTLSAATRRRAFIGMGWVSVAFVSASAAPSPLYHLYQEQWHFASYLLSVAFSVYAFTLLIALLFAGSLSDHLGRRPVLAAAIIAELVAMIMLLLATNVAGVLVARAIQGFATGVATATVSAALADLSPAHNKQLGATVGSITPLAGLAIGSGAAGLIVQASHAPIHIVFTAILVILVIGMVFVVTAPETIRRQPGAFASLAPQLRVPAASRSAFVASSFLNIAVWLTTSLALGLIPQINREVFHIDSGVANGGIIALLTGIGAVAVVLSRKLPTLPSTLLAAVTLAAGALSQAVGVLTDDLIVFIIGAAIGGVGVGVGFGGYIRLVIQTADAHDRAAVFSAMYVVSYLTFGIPVIVAGIVLDFAPAPAVAAGFCALTVLSSVLGLITVRRFARKASA